MLLMPLSALLAAGEGSRVAPRIAGCEGFRVTGPRGSVGVVIEVRERLGSPAELLVAAGTWRVKTVAIPATDVLEVDPRAASVRVRSAAPHGGRAKQARPGRLWARRRRQAPSSRA
jgi:hypothetical protein